MARHNQRASTVLAIVETTLPGTSSKIDSDLFQILSRKKEKNFGSKNQLSSGQSKDFETEILPYCEGE